MCQLQISYSPTQSYIHKLEAKAQITIGRSSLANIEIKSTYVSRHHCSLILMEKEQDLFYWLLRDNKSSNGTWVNSKRIKLHPLKHQDVITFYGNSHYPNVTFVNLAEGKEDSSNDTGAYEYEKE